MTWTRDVLLLHGHQQPGQTADPIDSHHALPVVLDRQTVLVVALGREDVPLCAFVLSCQRCRERSRGITLT